MKKTLTTAIAALLTLSLVGCGQPISAPATTTSTASTPMAPVQATYEGRTLTMLLELSDGASKEGTRAQIAAFEAKYGCTVEVEEISGGDEGENIRMVRLATGALSDVYTNNVGSSLDNLDPINNCYDLSKEAWIGNVAEGYLDACTYSDGIYAVPTDTSNVGGVFYNKDVFEAQSIKIPETWEEFLAVCEVLKAKNIIPVAAPYATTTNSQIPFLANYYYVTQENPDFAKQYTNREIELQNSEAFVGGLQKMYDLAKNAYLDEDYQSTSMEDCAAMLGDGTAAMMLIRTNIISTMESVSPESIEHIGFFPIPDKTAQVRGVSYWLPQGYLVNKNAQDLELALRWCEFVTTQEGVDAFCSAASPTGTFCLNGITVSTENAYAPIAEAQSWVSGGKSCAVMQYACAIKGANQPTICSMVASGEITAAEGVEKIAQDNMIDAQQKGLAGW